MGVYISGAAIPRLLRAYSLVSSESPIIRKQAKALPSILSLARELKEFPVQGEIAVARIVAERLWEKKLTDGKSVQLVTHYFDMGEKMNRTLHNRLPAGWPINDLMTAKAMLDDLVPLAAALGEPISANRYLNALLEITSDGIIRRVCPFSVPATKIAPGAISALADLFKPVVGDLPKVEDVLEALDFMGPLRITAGDKGKLFKQIFAHRNTETLTGIVGLFTARHNYSGEDKLALFAAALHG
jgi:hypothetical protein